MPFIPLPPAATRDKELQRVFQHASAYLADVYTMLGANPSPESKGGRCNFSIALVLACVIDGLATEVYPVVPVDEQEPRMRALLARMPWGAKKHGWITPGEAFKVIYNEVRNPLVHNLGADTRPRVRRRGFKDVAVVHPMLDGRRVPPDEVEAMESWPEKWPVMWAQTKKQTKRIVVAVPALYWHVKALARALAVDAELLRQALDLRKRRRVQARDK